MLEEQIKQSEALTKPYPLSYSLGCTYTKGDFFLFLITHFILIVNTIEREFCISLFGTKKVVIYSIFQVCVLFNMCQNQEKSNRNGINIDKAIERFLEVERNKKLLIWRHMMNNLLERLEKGTHLCPR